MNSNTTFEELLEGEIDIISYENIFIVCKKERDNLRPNIYLNISFGKFDTSIRGNLLIVSKDNQNFISLTRPQLIKYTDFLIRESFNYNDFDKNGKYISTKELDSQHNVQLQTNFSKGIDISKNNVDETFTMILRIQSAILQFIKYNSN